MFKRDFFWINALALLFVGLIWIAGGCGTGVGNPSGPALGGDAQGEGFHTPISEYDESGAASQPGGVDCGSFDEESTLEEVEGGRQCIRDAFQGCNPAQYLLDQTNPDETRITSFVEVRRTSLIPLTCEVYVHTVSTDPVWFVGDDTGTCSELSASDPIEMACGVGD